MRRFQRLVSAAMLSGAVWLGGGVCPQLSAGPGPTEGAPVTPRKYYLKSRNFQLPASTDNLDKSAIAELRLYCRTGNGDWVLKGSVPPTQTLLSCSVPQDGEYLFTIVAVDRDGKMPALDATRPGSTLLVIVDTRPPEVAVQPLPSTGERVLLQCQIRDDNPDYRSLIVEYPAASGGWQVLAPLPDRVGVFALPPGQGLPAQVRVIASDLAGNTATRTINLAEVAVPALPRGRPVTITEVTGAAPAPVTEVSPPPPPPPPSEVMETRAASVVPPPPESIGDPAPVDSTPRAPEPPRQFTNRTHVALKYQVDELGPSGIGKMEAWVTRDHGRKWQYLADDPDRQSPIELDLPGDGIYGLSLVVRNGIGFGGRPPAPGEAPQCYVEVDTAKPTAQLQTVRPVGDAEGPVLEISWNAGDKNLGEEPIELLYAPGRDGPWTPIGPRLKNTGKCRWLLPAGIGQQVYVRLVVADLAGNVSQSETDQPVTIDLTQPKVHVLGLEVTAPAPLAGGSAN